MAWRLTGSLFDTWSLFFYRHYIYLYFVVNNSQSNNPFKYIPYYTSQLTCNNVKAKRLYSSKIVQIPRRTYLKLCRITLLSDLSFYRHFCATRLSDDPFGNTQITSYFSSVSNENGSISIHPYFCTETLIWKWLSTKKAQKVTGAYKKACNICVRTLKLKYS